MPGTNFNILSKPPPDGDQRGWYRWFYRVCEILNNPAVTGLTPAATVVSETTPDLSPVVGTALEYARQDHGHGTSQEQPYDIVYDDSLVTTIYIGDALPGTGYSAASWRMRKLVLSSLAVTTTWADGDQLFNNVWNNRTSLTYV